MARVSPPVNATLTGLTMLVLSRTFSDIPRSLCHHHKSQSPWWKHLIGRTCTLYFLFHGWGELFSSFSFTSRYRQWGIIYQRKSVQIKKDKYPWCFLDHIPWSWIYWFLNQTGLPFKVVELGQVGLGGGHSKEEYISVTTINLFRTYIIKVYIKHGIGNAGDTMSQQAPSSLPLYG